MTSLRFFLVTLGCEVFSVKRDSFGHPKRAQNKKKVQEREKIKSKQEMIFIRKRI